MTTVFNKLKKTTALCASALVLASILTGCSISSVGEEKDYRAAGIDYMVIGDYENALTAFNNALADADNGVGGLELDICYYKAEAQYKSGDTNGALDTYSAIIAYNDSAEAHYLRGNLYFAAGDFDSGEADFAAAVEKSGKNYDLYIGISQILTRYGYADEGTEYLQTAYEFSGSSATDLMQKGRIAWMLGDTDTAIEDLQQSAKKGKAEANFYLSQIYTEQGEDAKSDECFQAYIDSGKADSDSLVSLGESSMNTGSYAAALSYFKAAEEIGGVSSEQRLTRDMIIAYEYSQEFSAARDLLQQYIKDYSDDYEADDELTFLGTR